MSTYLWSLFSSRTRSLLYSPALRVLQSQPFQAQTRSLSLKRLEEKKVERLAVLRSVVASNYRTNNGSIQWDAVRKDLESRGHYFRTNFEFALLTAFDDNEKNTAVEANTEEEPVQMDQQLFQSIADYVLQSPAVNSNKIAALRYCRFLSSAPEYLSKPQIDFIKHAAGKILEENIKVPQIIGDVITALAHSSAPNCLHTLTIYERYLTGNFKLKLEVLQIVFTALLRYELSAELHQFVLQHGHLLRLDTDLTGTALRHIAKKRVYENSPGKVLDILRLLSSTFAPVDAKYRNVLTERILTRKLGYTNITPTRISPQGVCSTCGTRLQGLTAEEFACLKSNFRTIIFDKNDQYLIANLAEYEVQLFEFEDKITGSSPFGPSRPKYDLIIDSLNLSYRQSSSIIHDTKGLRTFARVYKIKDLDQRIVRSLQNNRIFDRFDRSLLIGRAHMQQWYNLNRLLRQKAQRVDHLFLLNKTRDDNYILYAAIQHPATKILSTDYFRDHREKFNDWYLNVDSKTTGPKPNLGQIFSRWLRSRQIKLDDENRLKYPNEFDMKIHVHECSDSEAHPSLHIPIITEQDAYENEDHVYEWICARHQ